MSLCGICSAVPDFSLINLILSLFRIHFFLLHGHLLPLIFTFYLPSSDVNYCLLFCSFPVHRHECDHGWRVAMYLCSGSFETFDRIIRYRIIVLVPSFLCCLSMQFYVHNGFTYSLSVEVLIFPIILGLFFCNDPPSVPSVIGLVSPFSGDSPTIPDGEFLLYFAFFSFLSIPSVFIHSSF